MSWLNGYARNVGDLILGATKFFLTMKVSTLKTFLKCHFDIFLHFIVKSYRSVAGALWTENEELIFSLFSLPFLFSYFINHYNKQTTWVDPRGAVQPQQQRQGLAGYAQQQAGYGAAQQQQQQAAEAERQRQQQQQQQEEARRAYAQQQEAVRQQQQEAARRAQREAEAQQQREAERRRQAEAERERERQDQEMQMQAVRFSQLSFAIPLP